MKVGKINAGKGNSGKREQSLTMATHKTSKHFGSRHFFNSQNTKARLCFIVTRKIAHCNSHLNGGNGASVAFRITPPDQAVQSGGGGGVHGCAPWGGGPIASRAAHSSSVNTLERIKKRTPSGASTEKPLPRPLTTSRVRWVPCQ